MDSSTQGHIAYLIDAVEVGTQTTMDAKDASVNNRSEGEVVEDFTTPPPDISSAVFALTLVVKAVYLCDLPRLVVPADECHPFRVADLESKEE